jgi:hypothetical protein
VGKKRPARRADNLASIFRGLLLYTRPFSIPHKNKSGGVRSGDLGGYGFLKINRYFGFPCQTVNSTNFCIIIIIIMNTLTQGS